MYRTTLDQWPSIGDERSSLQTPVLIFDLQRLRRNLQSFLDLADDYDVRLRPHVKAHKIPELAQKQVSQADSGIMCQKISEAEVMARHGLDDILVVCPVVSPAQLKATVWLEEFTDSLAIVGDSKANIRPLERTAAKHDIEIGIVLELDVSGERTGAPPGSESAALAEYIGSSESLRFSGLLAYDNHILYGSDTQGEFRSLGETVTNDLKRTINHIEAKGIPVSSVKAGTTGTAKYMAKHAPITEINPGRYILNDTSMVKYVDEISRDDCAATFLTTVLSKPTKSRAIVDAGAKSICWTSWHKPLCRTDPNIRYTRAASEHGILDLEETDRQVSVGDKLEFIVPNLYGAINLQDYAVGMKDGEVTDVWSISARGKSH